MNYRSGRLIGLALMCFAFGEVLAYGALDLGAIMGTTTTTPLITSAAITNNMFVTADGGQVAVSTLLSGLTTEQKWLGTIIALLVPMVITSIRAKIPSLPGPAIVLLCPVLGFLGDSLAGLGGLHNLGPHFSLLAGAAAIGFHQIQDQLHGAITDKLAAMKAAKVSQVTTIPSVLAPPIDNAHVAEGCEKFTAPAPTISPAVPSKT